MNKVDSSNTIKVMLVDDHAVVRAGYTFLLENVDDIEVISEADNGEDAITQFDLLKPDVLVIDLSMPGIGGFGAIKKILQRHPSSRILVFSMHENTPFIERAIQEGAAGYISKNSSPETLVSAIREIALGNIYIDAQLAQNMVAQQLHNKDSHFSELSSREVQILCLFAEAHTTDEMAKELSLSTKTISNYLTQIKEKLHVNSAAELVRLAISKGLVSV